MPNFQRSMTAHRCTHKKPQPAQHLQGKKILLQMANSMMTLDLSTIYDLTPIGLGDPLLGIEMPLPQHCKKKCVQTRHDIHEAKTKARDPFDIPSRGKKV